MLQNTKILHRIALSNVLPLITLAALAAYEVCDKWAIREELVRLQPVAEGVAQLSRFVHQLQRERGLSSAFLGSKGAQMRVELQEQRKRTDAERAMATRALSDLSRQAGAELASASRAAGESMMRLDQRRNEIDGQAITQAAAFSSFEELINRLVSVITGISKLSMDDDISRSILAYASLIEGKERAAQERGVVAGSIAAGRFEPQVHARAIGLAAAQESFFASFRGAASPKARDLFVATMSGSALDKFNEMRKALEQAGVAGDLKSLDGKAWFDAATTRTDLLKTVEDGLSRELAGLMSQKKDEASFRLAALTGLALLALLISLVAVVTMARSISSPLNVLAAAMKRLASGELDQHIDGTERRDEIGVMAAAVQFFKENIIRRSLRRRKGKLRMRAQTGRRVSANSSTVSTVRSARRFNPSSPQLRN
jgi:HAMP domain-containing protein